MSTGNSKNSDEHKLKELRVALPKMKAAESHCQPSTSSQGQDEGNVTAGESAERKFPESDDSKNPKKNKNVVPSGNPKIKNRQSKVKPNPPEVKEKEQQKSAKSGGQEAKTRPAPREQKNKTEPEKSPGMKKEKGNTPKDKSKERRVSGGQKEKNTPKKGANNSQGPKEGKELLRDDPNLPPGWKRIIKGKHIGSELKPVVCIASPEGRKFYFKAKLLEYLQKTKSHLSINQFYFGLYKRNVQQRAENRNANSDGKKARSRRSRKQKRSESVVDEHETKKIRLDSDSGPAASAKKAQAAKQGGGGEQQKSSESSDEGEFEAGDKNMLLEDPNLPEGWVRQVLIKNDANGHNKIQVWIISPDGKKFQRKNVLQNYLQRTKSTLDINQFYFGIYPKREESTLPKDEPSTEPAKKGRSRRSRRRGRKGEGLKKEEKEEDKTESVSESLKNTTTSSTASKSDGSGDEPMFEDPNLPPGWRRFIKVRSAGESAGRMEVIIASPDGKRHRSKGALEQYIKQKGLDLNVDDFDFTVFGKNSKRYSTGPAAASTPKQKSEKSPTKKKGSASQTPASGSRNASAGPSPEKAPSHEAAMINYVSALMLTSGLRDLRTERRLRVQDQEKVLKEYLDSLGPEHAKNDDGTDEIPSTWVKKLALCRSDFGKLEDDAAETIAGLTKDFISRLAQTALKESDDPTKLEYNDIANVIDKNESLAPMRTLIPKKITYKEYMRISRQKKYTSFT